MREIVCNLTFLVLFFSMASCSQFLTGRTFLSEMDRETDGFFVAGRDFDSIPGDSGNAFRSRKEIEDRTPVSRKVNERRSWDRSIDKELARREQRLSMQDHSLYRKRKIYLETDSEKIYYLQLSRNEREDYLASKMVQTSSDSNRNERSPFGIVRDHSRSQQELFLGMDKGAVERSWGSPSRIDVAGNPRNQNERWTFYQGNRAKQIYFENGVVGGWTTE